MHVVGAHVFGFVETLLITPVFKYGGVTAGSKILAVTPRVVAWEGHRVF